ncbi:hypothetical protein L3X38_045446 [Prunus dulcis]|uniref:Retrotransposon gag domain-containing protein n=1 Tax=Prunus dulcis TaxID=3755 RepID=A0AAD4YP71_PRUDU|nr:hypothetical protein L3X38_045446 [Prunus dulcis]
MAENNNNNNALEGPQNDEDNHALEGPQNDEDNHSVHNDENRCVCNDENPLVRTLHDYLHPARTSVPSCIIFPFKLGMIQLVPTFHGMESENPYSHVRELEEVCGTFPTQGCRLDTALLKNFPFSLKDIAKTWLYSLRPRTIGTWLEMQTEFFKEFFLLGAVFITLRRKIVSKLNWQQWLGKLKP